MKRVIVVMTIMIVILAFPLSTESPLDLINHDTSNQHGMREQSSFATTSGKGDTRTSTKFASRQVTGLDLQILNSYASTGVHSASLDFSDYLIPGWSFYRLDIEVASILATVEHESTGITPNTYISVINNALTKNYRRNTVIRVCGNR